MSVRSLERDINALEERERDIKSELHGFWEIPDYPLVLTPEEIATRIKWIESLQMVIQAKYWTVESIKRRIEREKREKKFRNDSNVLGWLYDNHLVMQNMETTIAKVSDVDGAVGDVLEWANVAPSECDAPRQESPIGRSFRANHF